MTSPGAARVVRLVFAATMLFPVVSTAAPAPAPTLDQVASQAVGIPKESALAVLRLMKPEGLGPGEEVKTFEVRPWEAAQNTWIAMLAVDGCVPVIKREGTSPVDVPWLWLALVRLPPPPAPPVLLARPVGGFMQAREYTIHRYRLGAGPIRLGPGEQGFAVEHSFNIPFGGGGADVTVDHVFWLDHGSLSLVFDTVSRYGALYAGDWNDDGTRDHSEEDVALKWEVTKRVTDGFFNLRVQKAGGGPKARKAVYEWQGAGYATSARPLFEHEGMCLEDGALTSPPAEWQRRWLGAELKRLLAVGDLDGVMGLDLGFQDRVREGDDLLDKAARARILALAHERALARYQSDSTEALRLLGYGIGQVTEAKGVDAVSLYADPPAFDALVRQGSPTTVAALNDYAFILGKNKRHADKATTLLRAVLVVDPKRKVAYLNLADLLWSQGKKEEARDQYGRYLALAGAGAADVPSRARERASGIRPPSR